MSAGPVSLFMAALSISTETEETANRWQSNKRKLVHDKKYFRWNIPHIGDNWLDEANRINEISAETDKYLSKETVHQRVRDCAHRLRNETGKRPAYYIVSSTRRADGCRRL